MTCANSRSAIPTVSSRLEAGALIVNADDWGRDHETTDRIFDCVQRQALSSVSAMVFMEDSERAAEIARTRNIDAGLHLNLTTAFTGSGPSARLVEYQGQISRYLLRHRFAQVLFHPGLMRLFDYVVKAQCDEFLRLYGTAPGRIDGHHHMHLCANVLFGRLLPAGSQARRTFSFWPGEKGLLNRAYRQILDKTLARRHQMTDFFFSLAPIHAPGRLERILSLAGRYIIELETHPVKPEEHRFLTGGDVLRWANGIQIASHFVLPTHKSGRECS
jgi:YdjC-like protein